MERSIILCASGVGPGVRRVALALAVLLAVLGGITAPAVARVHTHASVPSLSARALSSAVGADVADVASTGGAIRRRVAAALPVGSGGGVGAFSKARRSLRAATPRPARTRRRPAAPAGNLNVSIRVNSPGDDGPVLQLGAGRRGARNLNVSVRVDSPGDSAGVVQAATGGFAMATGTTRTATFSDGASLTRWVQRLAGAAPLGRAGRSASATAPRGATRRAAAQRGSPGRGAVATLLRAAPQRAAPARSASPRRGGRGGRAHRRPAREHVTTRAPAPAPFGPSPSPTFAGAAAPGGSAPTASIFFVLVLASAVSLYGPAGPARRLVISGAPIPRAGGARLERPG